jgi:endosialidase-like protein
LRQYYVNSISQQGIGAKYVMKTLYQSLLLALGALALAGTAFAQVPSTNDTSGTNANIGMGTGALGGPNAVNLTGGGNTASGDTALANDTSGSDNTASGFEALLSNTIGNRNTASGVDVLHFNTTGNDNTASGFEALFLNTSGSNNTASGYQALYSNTTGNGNTASGLNALHNTTGNNNTASGEGALRSNTTGSNNIAVGVQAGLNLTTGGNNIDIGNKGVAAESDTIRLGTTPTHKATYVAGIYNVPLTGNAVVVTSSGQLGVQAVSSERFKTSIAPMGANTAKLGELRPVTFHLKTDPNGALQYGLIAEEVAKVYPELVIRDEKGRIDGVRYDELAPMLLNELQQEKQKSATQAGQIAAQAAQLRDVQRQLAVMQAAFAKQQSTELVAQR